MITPPRRSRIVLMKDPCPCCQILNALLIGLTLQLAVGVVLVAILHFKLPAYQKTQLDEFNERLTERLELAD